MINNNVICFKVEDFKYLGTTLTNKNSIQEGGNLRERDHWGDPDVDWRIILTSIFRKWEGVVGTGWNWLRIGTGGGHL
jgi:hypothetical protein